MYSQSNQNSIKQLFNNISEQYDLINNVMSFGLQYSLKKTVVNNINFKPENIIDLCTGTGDIARLLSEKFPTSKIIAIDFSEEMIKIAKKKSENYKNITYKIEDINSNDIPTETFDLCFISFGLRNQKDIQSTLKHIYNLLKPNGILSIIETGHPKNKIISALYNIYLKLLPNITSIITPDKEAYQYFTKTIRTYPAQSEIINILKETGFSDFTTHNFLFGTITQLTSKKMEH